MKTKIPLLYKGLKRFEAAKIIFSLSLFLLISSHVSAQDNVVTGKVTDDKGEPVIGAVISLKDGSGGATTDIEGNYSIVVNDMQSAVLVINYTGLKTTEVPVKGQSKLDVKMEVEPKELQQVVVVGYGSKTKPRVTESISSVSAKEMSLTVNPSLENALQGRAAGVQVTQTSGSPGAASTIRIRGLGSINGGEPLYVIDGVPVSSGTAASEGNPDPAQRTSITNLINPNDIQSVDILKDASATAIYGARGANGVVIITTKRGKEGSTRINFEAFGGVQQAWKKLPLLNTQDYLSLINDERKNGNVPPPSPDPLNPNSGNPYLQNNTDWQKAIFRPGYQQSYNLNISGGNSIATYSVSGGYFKQQGTMISTDFDRYSFRVNSDIKPKSWFRMGESISLSTTGEHSGYGAGGLMNIANVSPPILPIYDENGNYTQINKAYVGSYNWPNVVALNSTINNNTNRMRTLGNVYAELEPLKGLKYRLNLGLDFVNSKSLNINEVFVSGDAVSFAADIYNRKVTDSRDYQISKLIDNILSYEKTFGKHYLLAMTGVSMQDYYYSSISGYNATVPSQINTVGYTGKGGPVGGGDGQYALKGYLGRLNYTYADKYLLTVNARYDGSSKFGANNRYGTFPSASIGWRPLQERFIQHLTVVQTKMLSDLKLRASWGKTGNQDALTPNRTQVLLNSTIRYPFNPNGTYSSGLAPTGLANQNLQWESVAQTDVGFDLGLLRNKISLTFDYYVKQSTGMLIAAPIPATSGFYQEGENPYFRQWVNAGNMVNKGYELALTYRDDDHKFKYSISGNFSHVNNKVTKLGDDNAPIIYGDANSPQTYTMVGVPAGSFYGYVAEGVYTTEAQIAAAPYQANSAGVLAKPKLGDMIFANLNGDTVIDANDRKILGNAIPKFSYGVTFTAEYAGFDLRVFFQGVNGNKIYNQQRRQLEAMGGVAPNGGNQLTTVNDRWTYEGQKTDMPRAVLGDPNWNGRPSSRWIEDGSYLRLKTIQLGYSIPKNLIAKLGNKVDFTARFYVSVMNALTFTKYKGYDPELASFNPLYNGVDNGTYPQARTYLVGLQFGF